MIVRFRPLPQQHLLVSINKDCVEQARCSGSDENRQGPRGVVRRQIFQIRAGKCRNDRGAQVTTPQNSRTRTRKWYKPFVHKANTWPCLRSRSPFLVRMRSRPRLCHFSTIGPHRSIKLPHVSSRRKLSQFVHSWHTRLPTITESKPLHGICSFGYGPLGIGKRSMCGRYKPLLADLAGKGGVAGRRGRHR